MDHIMSESKQVTLPFSISDALTVGGRKIPVRIEIHEESTLAYLEADEDFFAEGKTIKEAKESLLRGLQDELEFFKSHASELSDELRRKYELIRELLR